MRTFSQLRAHCAYPLTLEALGPRKYARDIAARKGSDLHARVDGWVRTGELDLVGAVDEVRAWAETMARGWSPPPGCRSEWALGLTRDALRGVEVDEPEPHVYRARNGDDWVAVASNGIITTAPGGLVTAGRCDLAWVVPGVVDVLHVADIKTGRTYLGPPARIPQLAACALAARWVLRAPFPLRVGVYYARLGVWDWETVETETDLVEVVRAAVDLPDAPRVGGWCLGCYNAKECEAYPRG
jgi:hypothetical protein